MKGVASWVPGPFDHDWIESIGQPIHPELARLEQTAGPGRVPILDRSSGRVLAVLASDRRRIAEVGTAIGYSTLWMALAQPAGGTIVTIDPDAARTTTARSAWRAAGIDDERVTVVNAPALDALGAAEPALDGPFDLLFIDALKDEYLAYLEAFLPRLAPGALVVADNVLWSGAVSAGADRDGDDVAEDVADDAADPDPDATHLRRFCAAVLADPRFRSTILPVGDGLLVAVLVG